MSTLPKILDESPDDPAAWDRMARAIRARRFLDGLLQSPFLDDQARAARATRAYTAGGAR